MLGAIALITQVTVSLEYMLTIHDAFPQTGKWNMGPIGLVQKVVEHDIMTLVTHETHEKSILQRTS